MAASAVSSNTVFIPDGPGNFVLDQSTSTLTNKTISGTANTLSNISLTSSVTGVLPAANGGTGVNSTATFPSSGTVAVLTDISASQLSGIVPGSKGGTGVNNAGTLTYGTNNITLTTSGVTSLTLPTSGTVVTESGSATLLNKQISSTAAITGALTLPSGSEGQRPGSPVDGMVRYNTDSGSFEGRANGNWSGIGGGGTTDLITQASHGFAVGDVLYLSGSTYTKAIATAANTAEVVGIVSRVVSSSQFEMTLSGEISGLIASSFAEGTLPAVGEALFLSDSVAGKLTITEPSTIGYVSIPVGVVSESVVGPPASRKMYVAIKRGVIVGGVNARTQIPLANNATTTVQNVAAYEAGELSGWIAISATTPLKFYVTAQFSKNGAGNNYNISYQTSGDTPPVGFLLQVTAAGLIQAVLPSITGFASASITYGLDVAAIGTSFPLSVDGSSITTGTINDARIPSLDASKIATGTLDAARIPSLSASKITLRTSGAPTSNAVAFAGFSGTLPKTATLPSTGSSYQIVNYSIFFRYNNTNGTLVTPRVQIEIRDGATSLYAVIFTNSVVTGFNDYMSFSGLAILPAPATSYSVIASDVQIDGASHSITNSFLSCSSSLIVF